MKQRPIVTAVIAFVLALALGWWGRGYLGAAHEMGAGASSAGDGPCPGGAAPQYWKAPMDPTYIRNEPGKSPMGMDLVPVCETGATKPGGGTRIEPGLVQNMGVRTALVTRRDLAREVRAVGRVAVDERRVEHIHTKVQGWIEKLFVEYEGAPVRKGQPLLEIYSPELVSTQEELLLAARYRDATSESSFEDVSQGGEDLLHAARRRLELWDIPRREIDRLIESGTVRKNLTLNAPVGGVVTHLMAREGMEIGPNDNLYTIADLSRIWVYADVYEYELPWVREGQRATIDLSYLPGRRFEGTVTYVYPMLDPKTRTARVRVELENPDMLFKPEMFANVTIETQVQHGTLAVPEEAVIRSGRRTLAIVARGEGRFSPQEVVLGIASGDGWVEVVEGLAEGDRIVTSGQFLIDSESKLQEAVKKMLAPEPAAEPSDPHAGHEMPMPASSEEASAPDPHAGHAMPMPAGREEASAPDPHAGHGGHADPTAGTQPRPGQE